MPASSPAPVRRVCAATLQSLALLTAAVLLVAVFARVPARAQTSSGIDRILVLKSEHLLELMHGHTAVKSYRVDLGRNPVGPKRRQGDDRTPEGTYTIDGRQISKYHLALHISYPSAEDVALARARRRDPGGSIFIHGFPRGFELADPTVFRKDWTAGCIAVSNEAIEEIWRLVADGTVVEIRP